MPGCLGQPGSSAIHLISMVLCNRILTRRCASQHGPYFCDESNPGWTLWPGRRFSSWTWSPGSSAGWRKRRSRLLGVLASSLLSSSPLSIVAEHKFLAQPIDWEWLRASFRKDKNRFVMSIPDKNWQPPFVSLETTMGEVVVELYWHHAPITCRWLKSSLEIWCLTMT